MHIYTAVVWVSGIMGYGCDARQKREDDANCCLSVVASSTSPSGSCPHSCSLPVARQWHSAASCRSRLLSNLNMCLCVMCRVGQRTSLWKSWPIIASWAGWSAKRDATWRRSRRRQGPGLPSPRELHFSSWHMPLYALQLHNYQPAHSFIQKRCYSSRLDWSYFLCCVVYKGLV